jgi:protein-L-isoaspartate(D-aspartate) O-methyltransferase
MIREQIIRRGVKDDKVLKALLEVPRHQFVDSAMYNQAYSDNALPISEGQTISQPYMVAVMTELLDINKGDRVLEIGTGCGYQAAVLYRLSPHVFTIERMEKLVRIAKRNLKKLGMEGIKVCCGDGTLGWPEEAPFDRIIITAGAPAVPDTLFDQLKEGGKMVIPVGNRSVQELLVLEKIDGKKRTARQLDCVFVPLIGSQGWKE